jgi:CheY-like chemotaxis protein
MAPELSGDDAPGHRHGATLAIPPAMPHPHALSILVAEDNEINALLIRSLLTRLGHAPVITTDGEAALESWLAADTAGAPYDLVLMDIQMPRLDGITATKRIRAHEAGRSAQSHGHPCAHREHAGGRPLRLL